MARQDGHSRAALGLVSGMLFYNVAVAALLSVAALDSKLVGVATWPAVVLHSIMSIWCVGCILSKRSSKRGVNLSGKTADEHIL
jgi:hypothetical protein